jgi:PilZ domain
MSRSTHPLSSTILVERRWLVRYTPKYSTTIVVELGTDNGGNLLNVGIGGLSVQSVAELNLHAEILLRFRLQSAAEAIETVGRVVWLGPTKKQAGICFNNLPVGTEQEIADWITAQERPILDTESGQDFSSSITERRSVIPINEAARQSDLSGEAEAIPVGGADGIHRDSLLPKLSADSAPTGATAADNRTADGRETYSLLPLRRILSMVVMAGAVALLALYLFVPSFSTSLELRESAGEPVSVDSQSSAEWSTRLKEFFGFRVPAKIDSAKERVLVWTIQRSGFYYCSDSAYFQKLRPGKLVTQLEALQSGYQPKLGGYCH